MTRYTNKRWALGLAVTALATVTMLVGTALAYTITAKGGAIEAVWVVRSTDPQTTNSNVWAVVPGATASVTAPAGTASLFIARFSGESVCHSGNGYCSVRIRINGVPMEPAVDSDFRFDSTDFNDETYQSAEARSMDRSIRVAPGQYRVTVEYAVFGGATFTLDDWHLTVERAPFLP